MKFLNRIKRLFRKHRTIYGVCECGRMIARKKDGSFYQHLCSAYQDAKDGFLVDETVSDLLKKVN